MGRAFTGAALIGRGIGGRTRRHQRVVGKGNASRQHGRVVIHVAARAVFLRDTARYRHDACVYGGPIRRPLPGRVAGGVAGRSQRHQQAPAQRPLRQTLLQVSLQVVGIMLRLGRLRRRRVQWRQLPAHGAPRALRIDKIKGIQAVVAFGGIAGRRLGGLGPCPECRRLGVRPEEGLHALRIGLARLGIGPAG
ncbi:hypothetical protein D3C71_1640190 [compost metagenome]